MPPTRRASRSGKRADEIVYPPEELKKFAEVGAKPVWDSWIKAQTAKGIPAQELVNAVLAETEKAKKALNKM